MLDGSRQGCERERRRFPKQVGSPPWRPGGDLHRDRQQPLRSFGYKIHQAAFFDDIARLKVVGPTGQVVYDDVLLFNSESTAVPVMMMPTAPSSSTRRCHRWRPTMRLKAPRGRPRDCGGHVREGPGLEGLATRSPGASAAANAPDHQWRGRRFSATPARAGRDADHRRLPD